MANSTSPIPQVIEGGNAVRKINELFDTASQAMMGGRDSSTSSLLTWGYIGGRVGGVNTSTGTVTLTASATNYVVWKKSDGVVSASTSTTNWNDTGNYWRLYSVVVGATAPSTYADERSSQFGLFGIGNGASLSNPMTTAEDIIKGGSGGAPARLPMGADGQVLAVVSGSVAWATVAGTGDVVGPSSATDSAIALFDGTTGKLLKNGTDTIASLRSIPQNSQSTAYTLVLSDAGKHILHPSADTTARIMTIPANSSVAFPVGTAVTFVNQNAAGVMTIAITTDTMRLAVSGTTGSRTLAANGVATAIKIASTEWIISGVGLT